MRHLLCVVVLVGCGGAELERKPDAGGAGGEIGEAGTGSAGATGEAGAGPAGMGAAGAVVEPISMALTLSNCAKYELTVLTTTDAGEILGGPFTVPVGSCQTSCYMDPQAPTKCVAVGAGTAPGYCAAGPVELSSPACKCTQRGTVGQYGTATNCLPGTKVNFIATDGKGGSFAAVSVCGASAAPMIGC